MSLCLTRILPVGAVSGNEIESGFFDMIGVGVAIFIFL